MSKINITPQDAIQYAAANSARLFHHILDWIVVMIFTFSFNKMLRTYTHELQYPNWEIISYLVFMVTYRAGMESFYGQTIAKMITNSVVINSKGEYPTLLMAIIRSLGRLIPLNAIVIFFGQRTIHDMISGTYVINKNDLPLLLEDNLAAKIDQIGENR